MGFFLVLGLSCYIGNQGVVVSKLCQNKKHPHTKDAQYISNIRDRFRTRVCERRFLYQNHCFACGSHEYSVVTAPGFMNFGTVRSICT